MYGKKTSVYYEHNGGFKDRRLEIYDLKTCRKGIVYICCGWKLWKVLSTAKFYYKDCDADDYRIREYFGFLGKNVSEFRL